MLSARFPIQPPNGFAGLPEWKVLMYPDALKVKAGGAWRNVSDMWVKKNGAWQRPYRNNINDTAVGNVLSGIVANDPQINDPSMTQWSYFWQNPAWVNSEQHFDAALSCITMTLSERNPDGTAVARGGPRYPFAVAPGWRITLNATVAGTARFTLGMVSGPTWDTADFFGAGAQWQESAFIPIDPAPAFALKTAEFVVPAGHNFIRTYASGWIQPDQPTGTRSFSLQSFPSVRKS